MEADYDAGWLVAGLDGIHVRAERLEFDAASYELPRDDRPRSVTITVENQSRDYQFSSMLPVDMVLDAEYALELHKPNSDPDFRRCVLMGMAHQIIPGFAIFDSFVIGLATNALLLEDTRAIEVWERNCKHRNGLVEAGERLRAAYRGTDQEELDAAMTWLTVLWELVK